MKIKITAIQDSNSYIVDRCIRKLILNKTFFCGNIKPIQTIKRNSEGFLYIEENPEWYQGFIFTKDKSYTIYGFKYIKCISLNKYTKIL